MNVLIIDDEFDACRNIEHTLLKHFTHHIKVIHIVHSTAEAEMRMKETQFDLFFIDIEMPYESGIDFACRKSNDLKNIIFVTAFDQYAVTAFRLHAMDYILKPIDEDIFIPAVQRTLNSLNQINKVDIDNLVKDIQNKTTIDRIVLRDKQQVVVVQISDIIYLEGEKSYTRIIYQDNNQTKSFLLSHNLSYYEEILDSYNFNRVHKSFIVNKTQIVKYYFDQSILLLKHNLKVPVSRRKQQSLIKWL